MFVQRASAAAGLQLNTPHKLCCALTWLTPAQTTNLHTCSDYIYITRALPKLIDIWIFLIRVCSLSFLYLLFVYKNPNVPRCMTKVRVTLEDLVFSIKHLLKICLYSQEIRQDPHTHFRYVMWLDFVTSPVCCISLHFLPHYFFLIESCCM